jgi:hypothetical protein
MRAPVLATPARKLPRVITGSNCGEQNPGTRRVLPAVWLEPDLGSDVDALERLRGARAILSPLGARPLLEEIDDLLGEETAMSS